MVIRTALAITLCIAIGWPLFITIEKDIELGTTEGRALAQVWLQKNLPPGAKVAVESYSPYVDPKLYQVQGVYQMIEHPLDWYVDQGFDYVILSQGMYGRFFREPQLYPAEIASYQRIFDRFERVQCFGDFGYGISFVDHGYEICVYKVHK
jgi:hypothetical protein